MVPKIPWSRAGRGIHRTGSGLSATKEAGTTSPAVLGDVKCEPNPDKSFKLKL